MTPSTKSLTRYGTPSAWPTSWTGTMAGWRSWAALRASRRKRSSSLVAARFPARHLDGHHAVQLRVAGLVDGAEGACPSVSISSNRPIFFPWGGRSRSWTLPRRRRSRRRGTCISPRDRPGGSIGLWQLGQFRPSAGSAVSQRLPPRPVAHAAGTGRKWRAKQSSVGRQLLYVSSLAAEMTGSNGPL